MKFVVLIEHMLNGGVSPSMRRVWIEITVWLTPLSLVVTVTLHAEGVD